MFRKEEERQTPTKVNKAVKRSNFSQDPAFCFAHLFTFSWVSLSVIFSFSRPVVVIIESTALLQQKKCEG